MNKPAPNNDTTVFLIVLATIGLILPIMLCGAGLMLFGFKSTRVTMPAPATATTLSATPGTYPPAAIPPAAPEATEFSTEEDPDLLFQPTTLP